MFARKAKYFHPFSVLIIERDRYNSFQPPALSNTPSLQRQQSHFRLKTQYGPTVPSAAPTEAAPPPLLLRQAAAAGSAYTKPLSLRNATFCFRRNISSACSWAAAQPFHLLPSPQQQPPPSSRSIHGLGTYTLDSNSYGRRRCLPTRAGACESCCGADG